MPEELEARSMEGNTGEGVEVDSKEAATMAVQGITERHPELFAEEREEEAPGASEAKHITPEEQQEQQTADQGQEQEFTEEELPGEPEQQELTAEEIDADDELYYNLLDMGIDLGLKPSEVPADLQDTYDEMVETVVNEHYVATEYIRQAEEARAQVAEFAERVSENPEQLLLTMALRDPETFDQAVDTFQRMQEDEEYADLVRRELEAEAKLSAAQRAEMAQQRTQVQNKARRVKNHTYRLAERMGVPKETAERVVAAEITRNGGDISMEAVDQIVKELAGGRPRRRQRKKQQAKQPEQQKKEQQANTQSIDGAGRPASRGDTEQQSKDSGRFGGDPNSVASTLKRVARKHSPQAGR